MQQQITIKYNDGSEDTYQVRPPDYAKWEMATKKVISNFGAMWDILYLQSVVGWLMGEVYHMVQPAQSERRQSPHVIMFKR